MQCFHTSLARFKQFYCYYFILRIECLAEKIKLHPLLFCKMLLHFLCRRIIQSTRMRKLDLQIRLLSHLGLVFTSVDLVHSSLFSPVVPFGWFICTLLNEAEIGIKASIQGLNKGRHCLPVSFPDKAKLNKPPADFIFPLKKRCCCLLWLLLSSVNCQKKHFLFQRRFKLSTIEAF